MKRIKLPTSNYLRTYFDYDCEKGKLIRIKKSANNQKLGEVKGVLHYNGYIMIRINNIVYMYHRVVYKMYWGSINSDIDHINGDRKDNRISNLRPCTANQNLYNTKKSKINSSGYKNLYWCKKDSLWYGAIQAEGKRIKFGWSKDKHKTISLISVMRRKLHGEFAKS